MRVSSFFAGIGGFDLGLERAGMNIVFQCELDPFCQQILKRHWPHVTLHDDITTLTAADLWCAGWPCQDLSTAISEWIGKRILEIEILEQKNLAADRSSRNHKRW